MNRPAAHPPVLAYHKVGTPELGGTWCTVGQLRAQLDSLTRAGWRGVELQGFEARIDAARAVTLPAAASDLREVLVTFDDAFSSFEQSAWPELERARFPAVLFVVTEFVGRRATWDLDLPGRHVPHLDWPALRALVQKGVAIGSHGATHRDLRKLDDPDLERELRASRTALEDALGVAVRSVSYPFGRYDERVQQAAARAGYTLGFSMCPPAGRAGRMAIRRHAVYVTDGARSVLDKVDANRTLHRFQDAFERGANACAAWAAR
jgi:peptidoglycan/xylan/chitin deacetylase (PgdA/CDA1 family)